MRVTCDTLTDARLAAAAARTICRAGSSAHGHDPASCSCSICHSVRLLTEVVALLGKVSAEAANRVY